MVSVTSANGDMGAASDCTVDLTFYSQTEKQCKTPSAQWTRTHLILRGLSGNNLCFVTLLSGVSDLCFLAVVKLEL